MFLFYARDLGPSPHRTFGRRAPRTGRGSALGPLFAPAQPAWRSRRESGESHLARRRTDAATSAVLNGAALRARRRCSLAHVRASCRGTLSGAIVLKIVHASASRVVSGDEHELALLLIHREPPRPMHYEQEEGAHRRDGLEEEVSLMVRHCERVHFETFHVRDALHLEGSISAQIPATAQRVRLVEL